MKWLVGDCPPAADVELPDDGRQATAGMRILVVSVLAFAGAVVVLLAHCAG